MDVIIFTDLTGSKFSQAGTEHAIKFTTKELVFWQEKQAELQDRINQSTLSGKDEGEIKINFISTINLSVNALKVLLSQLKNNLAQEDSEFYYGDEISDVTSTLERYWIYSESSFTTYWLALTEECLVTASAFYEAIIEGTTHRINEFRSFNGYMLAHHFKKESSTPLNSTAAAEKVSLKALYLEANSNQEQIIRIAKKKIDGFSRWQNEQEFNWNENLKSLESTYKEKLRLEGPAQYWGQKAKDHQNRGTLWISLLGIMLFLTTIALWTSFNIWLSGDKTKIGLNHVEGLLIFIAFLSTVAFFSKSLSKLAFSAFHLQRDAEEREQLTHLYLALSKDTKVDDESRKIVLQSLFSRSETGLISNESGPTMPGLVDLLSATKKVG